MSDMTDEQIASDLSATGCGCDEDASDDCPNMRDGFCRYQSDRINQALAAATEAGRQAGLREAAEIARPHNEIIAWTIRARTTDHAKEASDDQAK